MHGVNADDSRITPQKLSQYECLHHKSRTEQKSGTQV
jgi:hypothetical protein